MYGVIVPLFGPPSVVPLQRKARVRVRLPDGIMAQYKHWAQHMPILDEQKAMRKAVLVEMALRETKRRLEEGHAPCAFEHPLRTYSLIIDETLLDQINLLSKRLDLKCGYFISLALTDFLHRLAPDLYRRLKEGGSGQTVHGARRQ